MEVNVYPDKKLVELWFSNEEQVSLQPQLQKGIQEFKDKKYKVVIFRSGNSDLLTSTKALIKFNHQKIMQSEVNELRKEA